MDESTIAEDTAEGLALALQRIGVHAKLAPLMAEEILLLREQNDGVRRPPRGGDAVPWAMSLMAWLGGVFRKVDVAPVADGTLRVARGVPLETDEDEPSLDEQIRDTACTNALSRNFEARRRMTDAYAGAIEQIVRERYPVEHEGEIAQTELLRLVRELRDSSEVFTTRPFSGESFSWPDDLLDDGLPAWDAALARFLDARGFKKFAALVRERGAVRAEGGRFYAAWLDDGAKPPAAIRMLADAAKNEIAKKFEPSKPPGLTRVVHVGVLDVLSHPPKDTRQLPIRETTVCVAEGALEALQRGDFEVLRTLAALRLFHFLVTEGHDAYTLTGSRDVYLPEGYVGLAERLGLPANHAAPQLRNAAHALSKCSLNYVTPSGDARWSSNLITLDEPQDGRPLRGRPDVRITLTDPLLPLFTHTLDQGRSITARESRQVVPMLRELPSFVGKRRDDYAAQGRFAFEIVREMRDRAVELVEHHGVLMPWDQVAKRVAMRTPWRSVVDAWSGSTDEGGPLLVRRDGRFTLSDAHAAEREYLEEAGRLSIRQSRRAKMAVAKRKRKGHGS